MNSTSRAQANDTWGPTDWHAAWRTLFWSCAILFAANLFLWMWDYKYAFTVGLNSTSHAFTLHYRALFWAELLSVGAFAGLWFGWLVRTGMPLDREEIPPREEV